MTNYLWGPFQPLPECRLWLSEHRTDSNASEIELHPEVAAAYLSNKDLERWSRYRPPEKKQQFLNSRLAIRAVLHSEFGAASERFRVETLESGQPILNHVSQHQLASISLSHTGNMTAIAVNDNKQRLGVDIETVMPLNARTLSFSFINHFEHDWLAKEDLSGSPKMTLAIWTLKEALWKALGGPRDTSISEIVAEYNNSTLNGYRWTRMQGKQTAVTHFFGHRFSLPFALKNYSSIDCLDPRIPSFIGCIVLMDRATQDSC